MTLYSLALLILLFFTAIVHAADLYKVLDRAWRLLFDAG